MKSIVLCLLVMLSLVVIRSIGYGQSVVINEVYNSSGAEEWVELLVVQDGLDMRGWDIRDFSSGGAPQVPLVFSNSAAWSNLRSGTLIVIARSENVFAEDIDPSDYSLTIKSNNATYLSGNPFSLAGASEAIELRNASQTHIFGVSWGTANAGSIPAPKVHFTGSSTSNTATLFTAGLLSDATNIASWTQNSATNTRAVGNNTANSNWISALRARPEGSGIASITPTVLSGSVDTTVTITYRRDTAFTISNLRVIVPSAFSWSHSLSDVNYTNLDATAVISGDTISLFSVVLHADSTEITIRNITSSVFTGSYTFRTQSGSASAYGDVAPTPTITVYGASIPIADTKINDANGVATRIGDLVTVQGIVTVGFEFGSPSYLQDNSGGMSIFDVAFSTGVSVGDEVVVTGRVAQFNGLNQLSNVVSFSIISSGNAVTPVLSTPGVVNADGAGGIENFEGSLVRLNGVTVTEINGSTVTSWVYKNYRLTGGSLTDTVEIRIDNGTNLIGAISPAGAFDVIGVLSQFKSASPYIGGYQIMPRSTADIISQGPLFSEFPTETNLAPTSLSIIWKTLNPGTTRVRYGLTKSYGLGVVAVDDVLRTDHSIPISGLNVATVYHVQAFSVSGTDTSFASDLIVSTTSAPPTTGQINVYFNKTVNNALSSGEAAQGNVDFVSKIIQRINNAHRSVDLALYSLSGTVGAQIATALISAKNRGVKVRVIGENDNKTTAPWTTLTSNGVPVIFDLYGPNDGAGLHHNKFFVIDARGGAPESVWVWTGSWNATDPGTNNDRQNVIEFQDVALAGAYTIEFEEEWGSNTETPNSSVSRFGPRKTDNTPHKFLIGGSPVESYFSPSDRTTSHIAATLHKAQSSVCVAILTFTRKDLADTLIALKNRGRKVRVVTDDISSASVTNNQSAYMISNGVDLLQKGFSDGLLHHKYAIVDGTEAGGTQFVVTGSHNWSNNAENSNNENTVIVEDNRVANLYLQEFGIRYTEAGGADPIVLDVKEIGSTIPTTYSLTQNYPNPFNPTTAFEFQIAKAGFVSVKVYDMLGREVATLVNDMKQPGTFRVTWDASQLSSGVYMYRMQAGEFSGMKKMLLVK